MLSDETPLQGLINIGPTIAARFREVGISTVGDLRRTGLVQAFHLVKAKFPDNHIPLCYYLYSLEGAMQGIHWDALPKKTKLALKHAAETSARLEI